MHGVCIVRLYSKKRERKANARLAKKTLCVWMNKVQVISLQDSKINSLMKSHECLISNWKEPKEAEAWRELFAK